jgi:hypothetical protein
MIKKLENRKPKKFASSNSISLGKYGKKLINSTQHNSIDQLAAKYQQARHRDNLPNNLSTFHSTSSRAALWKKKADGWTTGSLQTSVDTNKHIKFTCPNTELQRARRQTVVSVGWYSTVIYK